MNAHTTHTIERDRDRDRQRERPAYPNNVF